MSRKNLSRTVIEGGRYHRNQFERNHSHRGERASTRAWLDLVEVDTEHAEFTLLPRRRAVGKSFYDKLAPAKRWLASQVGRPWNKVYQELCATFDRKTIAGNHVVEHMLEWVQRSRVSGHGAIFVVDRHGILRRSYAYGRSYSKLYKEALAWASGRRIAKVCGQYWWFYARGVGTACSSYQCKKHHTHIDGRFHLIATIAIRALTEAEVRRLERLIGFLHNILL